MGRRSLGCRQLPLLDGGHRRVRFGVRLRRHHCEAARWWHAHPQMSVHTDERAHGRRRHHHHRTTPCSLSLSLSRISLALNRWIGEWGLGFVGWAPTLILFSRELRSAVDLRWTTSTIWITIRPKWAIVLAAQAFSKASSSMCWLGRTRTA
jgi:hypothetical protein